MGSPIPYDIRCKIVARRKAGESYDSLAQAFGYSISGVKKIWYAWEKEGEQAFSPQYNRCGRPKSFSEEVWATVDRIRDNQQGASYVYSRLLMRYPKEDCPTIRTIQRRWKAQLTNRKKGRPLSIEKKIGPNSLMKPGN